MSFNKSEAVRNAEKFLAQGKIRQAVSEYQEIVKRDPDDVSNLNILGDLLVKANQKDEALKCFCRVADHYNQKGFPQKAIAVYNKIFRFKPDCTDTLAKLAELNRAKGAIAEARAQFRKLADIFEAIGDSTKLIGAWKSLAELDKQDPELCIKLAELCHRHSKTSDAADAFAEAGDRLFSKNDLDRSLESYLRALEEDSEHVKGFQGYVRIALIRGTYTDAVDKLEDILNDQPENLDLRELLAECYLEMGEVFKAEDILLGLVSKESSRLRHLLRILKTHITTGEVKSAIRILSMTADHILSEDDPDKLLEWTNQILERDPSNLDAMRLQARYYTSKGDVLSATAVLDQISVMAAKSVASSAPSFDTAPGFEAVNFEDSQPELPKEMEIFDASSMPDYSFEAQSDEMDSELGAEKGIDAFSAQEYFGETAREFVDDDAEQIQCEDADAPSETIEEVADQAAEFSPVDSADYATEDEGSALGLVEPEADSNDLDLQEEEFQGELSEPETIAVSEESDASFEVERAELSESIEYSEEASVDSFGDDHGFEIVAITHETIARGKRAAKETAEDADLEAESAASELESIQSKSTEDSEEAENSDVESLETAPMSGLEAEVAQAAADSDEPEQAELSETEAGIEFSHEFAEADSEMAPIVVDETTAPSEEEVPEAAEAAFDGVADAEGIGEANEIDEAIADFDVCEYLARSSCDLKTETAEIEEAYESFELVEDPEVQDFQKEFGSSEIPSSDETHDNGFSAVMFGTSEEVAETSEAAEEISEAVPSDPVSDTSFAYEFIQDVQTDEVPHEEKADSSPEGFESTRFEESGEDPYNIKLDEFEFNGYAPEPSDVTESIIDELPQQESVEQTETGLSFDSFEVGISFESSEAEVETDHPEPEISTEPITQAEVESTEVFAAAELDEVAEAPGHTFNYEAFVNESGESNHHLSEEISEATQAFHDFGESQTADAELDFESAVNEISLPQQEEEGPSEIRFEASDAEFQEYAPKIEFDFSDFANESDEATEPAADAYEDFGVFNFEKPSAELNDRVANGNGNGNGHKVTDQESASESFLLTEEGTQPVSDQASFAELLTSEEESEEMVLDFSEAESEESSAEVENAEVFEFVGLEAQESTETPSEAVVAYDEQVAEEDVSCAFEGFDGEAKVDGSAAVAPDHTSTYSFEEESFEARIDRLVAEMNLSFASDSSDEHLSETTELGSEEVVFVEPEAPQHLVEKFDHTGSAYLVPADDSYSILLEQAPDELDACEAVEFVEVPQFEEASYPQISVTSENSNDMESVAAEEVVSEEDVSDVQARENRLASLLDSVDFFINEGFFEVAKTSFDAVVAEFGHRPQFAEIEERLALFTSHYEEEYAAPVAINSNASLLSVSPEPYDPDFPELSTLGMYTPEEIKNMVQVVEIDEDVIFDYETFYDTATAYREMGLLDYAVREFENALRLVSPNDGTKRFFQCCNMLGHCFMEFGKPDLAVMWFKRAQDVPGLTADEDLALLYEIAKALEAHGKTSEAAALLGDIHSSTSGYREVNDLFRRLTQS